MNSGQAFINTFDTKDFWAMPLEKPRRENQPRRDSSIELAGKFLSVQQQ
jgi:hypothetical protein